MLEIVRNEKEALMNLLYNYPASLGKVCKCTCTVPKRDGHKLV